MAAEIIAIHPQDPQPRKMAQVIESLRQGGLVIFPTDTVYGIGCDLTQVKAIQRIAALKKEKPEKFNLSFICHDLSHIADYAKHIDQTAFKMMKRMLPGPYTFILESSSLVPKWMGVKKKTVGIRIPNHAIALALVQELGNPLVSASLKQDDEISPYPTDPEEIYNQYKHLVDWVIDAGPGGIVPSTVIDCSQGEPELIRQGLGVWEG